MASSAWEAWIWFVPMVVLTLYGVLRLGLALRSARRTDRPIALWFLLMTAAMGYMAVVPRLDVLLAVVGATGFIVMAFWLGSNVRQRADVGLEAVPRQVVREHHVVASCAMAFALAATAIGAGHGHGTASYGVDGVAMAVSFAALVLATYLLLGAFDLIRRAHVGNPDRGWRWLVSARTQHRSDAAMHLAMTLMLVAMVTGAVP